MHDAQGRDPLYQIIDISPKNAEQTEDQQEDVALVEDQQEDVALSNTTNFTHTKMLCNYMHSIFALISNGVYMSHIMAKLTKNMSKTITDALQNSDIKDHSDIQSSAQSPTSHLRHAASTLSLCSNNIVSNDNAHIPFLKQSRSCDFLSDIGSSQKSTRHDIVDQPQLFQSIASWFPTWEEVPHHSAHIPITPKT